MRYGNISPHEYDEYKSYDMQSKSYSTESAETWCSNLFVVQQSSDAGVFASLGISETRAVRYIGSVVLSLPGIVPLSWVHQSEKKDDLLINRSIGNLACSIRQQLEDVPANTSEPYCRKRNLWVSAGSETHWRREPSTKSVDVTAIKGAFWGQGLSWAMPHVLFLLNR